MSDYIELRCRSAFSFLDGVSLPEALALRAADLGYPALALSDFSGLYGAPRFWKAARSCGLHPAVGAEVAIGSGRLLFLVQSRAGYRRLARWLTLGHARQAGRKEALLFEEDLAGGTEGLVCLAGGERSPLTEALRRGQKQEAERLARRLAAFFPGRLWIDVQRSRCRQVERRTRALAGLAAAVSLPVLASGDVRFATAEERFLADLFGAIRRGMPLDRLGRLALVNGEQFLRAPCEMAERFRDTPEWILATRRVAEQLEFTLDDLGYRFPEAGLPPGSSPNRRLRELAFAGASTRYGTPTGEREIRQIKHELTIIERLDLAGYFLIVHDIVRFCADEGILVQGRGSAANSAVCYALGITAVDPVGMELLFERFLSEERGEWPDIDLDLPSGAQREKVIQYLYRRYGGDTRGGPAGVPTVGSGVAMTANVITYRRRSALRDAGKALGFSAVELERWARELAGQGLRDQEGGVRERFIEAGMDLSSGRVARLAQAMEAMEGLPRHLGQHSGGMVLAAGRLDEIVPLEPASMAGRSVVQWDKDDCADLGMIKIDLLGLGMLAALEEVIPLVREFHGEEIDLSRIPPDDPETYAMIQRADTVGVFQIESRAQMATLPRLKPATFYDLVVEVAIIRPGPIVGKMVHPYLDRRAGREEVRYPHPSLEPILRRTLGVPLFQEQLLRIAITAAGFSPGEAEELRRAMGFKRSEQKMVAIEARLRQGLAANGIEGRVAEEIILGITSFAMYGFPESHAASFALIAYASAWLKAHYPAAFLCALLNAWPMGFYHPSTLISDAQRHGVEVRPVDIRYSDWRSSLEAVAGEDRPAVRLGLRFVQGLGEKGGASLARERREGAWQDLGDLARRTELSRRELRSLARAGALSGIGLGERRKALWQAWAMPGPGEPLLRGAAPAAGSFEPEALSGLEERLADYASTGVSVRPHLLGELRKDLQEAGILSVAELQQADSGAEVVVAGAVIVRQRPPGAKGVCFLTLEDETGLGNAIIMPDLFERCRRTLHQFPLLCLRGRVQSREDVVHLEVSRVDPLGPGGGLPPSHDYR